MTRIWYVSVQLVIWL